MNASRAVPPAIQRSAAEKSLRVRSRASRLRQDLGQGAGMNLGDREFLAPALEILETPPSPVHVALDLDHLRARRHGARLGLFRPHRHHRRRAGQVPADRAGQGDRAAGDRQGRGHCTSSTASSVQAGDVLVELDRSAAEADAHGARAELASARAEILRRKAALLTRRRRVASTPCRLIDWPDERRAGAARAREARSRRRSRPIGRDRRLVRRRARAKDGRARQAAARPSQRRRTSSRRCRSASTCARKLVDMKAGAKAAVIDATETLQYQITQLAKQEQELASLDRAARRHRHDNPTRRSRTSCPTTPRSSSEAERQAEDLEQSLAKAEAATRTSDAEGADRRARAIVDHHQCRAGRHERPGGHAHRAGGCRARDRGLCPATRTSASSSRARRRSSRSKSFPFTRYGSIKAHVTRVAKRRDSRARRQCDRGRSGARRERGRVSPARERTQNLVFPVVLEARRRRRSRIDGLTQPLTSGMAATVELKTGAGACSNICSRRWSKSPSKAMRER